MLDPGFLTARDKLLMQRKEMSLRSMEANLKFLFFVGFLKTVKLITQPYCPTRKPSQTMGRQLLPVNVKDVMNEGYIRSHDLIQCKLDDILAKAHDDLYDLSRF